MIKSFYLVLLQTLILLSNSVLGQIRVIQLPQNPNSSLDPIFYDKNEFRNVQLLSSDWNVNYENESSKKITVNVPAIFEGEESLVFEKEIHLTSSQIQNSQVVLGFLGLNYSADISLNNYSIYKHSGGAYPFEIVLPKDILKETSIITIKVNNKLDSDNSIPAKQRFLFPNVNGGIIREVYLKTISPLHLSHESFTYNLEQSFSKAVVNFKIGLSDANFKIGSTKNVIVRINLFAPNSTSTQAKGDFTQIISQENSEFVCKLDVGNVQLWSPQAPFTYLCEFNLIQNNQVIDKTVRRIAFYKIENDKNNFILNGNSFTLQGTTYFSNETSLRKLSAFESIKNDLTLIKNTGFNAVRFAKQFPNAYALEICQEIGLIAMIELPINSIPEEIISRNYFQLNVQRLAKTMISSYSNYSNTFIFGAGSSFLPNSELTENFISNICNQENEIKTYASFSGIQTNHIDNLDLYGIELFSATINSTKENLQKAINQLGGNSIFVSELIYPNYKGNLGGYLIKNSADAQAKYFGDMIDLYRQLKISGFFIHSLLEYRGEFASLYGSYSENNTYKTSILSSSRNINGIGYKVIASKLGDNSKVTIPIGRSSDESPIIFIILALVLSVIMALLINSKKKFREDCVRALLRPYNFFADIRDHRILSGIHSVILMLIEAGSISLLFTILLNFTRSSILLEKFLLSFGHHSLLKAVSYLAWNPQVCFVVLFGIVLIKFLILSVIIKFASFFIRTRVEFSNIFYTVIWTFLPFTLLLLLELILFKLLVYGSLNAIIIVFLLIFMLWILQRIIKGIYVIFDVRAFYVYLWSFIFIVLISGGILLKYQLSNSTLYYISNAIKQYKLMI